MAADVEFLLGLGVEVVLWVPLTAGATSSAPSLISILCLRLRAGCSTGWLIGLQYDSMHAVHWPSVLALPWEEFLASNGAGDDVADKWISLGQISGEVHLLPAEKSDKSWLGKCHWSHTVCVGRWI